AKRANLEEKVRQAKEWEAAMKASGRDNLSLTDPDSRRLLKVGVGYNVQIAVDAKSHFIVATEVVDAANDHEQLVGVGKLAREQLGIEGKMQLVADGGYYDRIS